MDQMLINNICQKVAKKILASEQAGKQKWDERSDSPEQT
jgi:hypothetical protein